MTNAKCHLIKSYLLKCYLARCNLNQMLFTRTCSMTSLEHVLFPEPLRKSRPALFPPISMILVRSTSRHPRKLISAQKSFNQSSWVKDSIATYPSQCSIAPTSFQLGEACLQNMSMRIIPSLIRSKAKHTGEKQKQTTCTQWHLTGLQDHLKK